MAKKILNITLLSFLFAAAVPANAASGNCDSIDKAPEKMRAKLEKMCADRLERKSKAEEKGKTLTEWSNAYFDGGKKRKAVYTIFQNHGGWLWPCKDYATDCAIDELQITKGIGNEIFEQNGNVVFLFKDATKGKAFVTCHTYVVDQSGETMISRESKVCGAY